MEEKEEEEERNREGKEEKVAPFLDPKGKEEKCVCV